MNDDRKRKLAELEAMAAERDRKAEERDFKQLDEHRSSDRRAPWTSTASSPCLNAPAQGGRKNSIVTHAGRKPSRA